VAVSPTIRNAAIAWFFFAIGCYTMLAPLDGPIPIGAAVVPFPGAVALAASIVVAGILAALSLRGAWRDERLAVSRTALGAWMLALVVPALFGFSLVHSLEVAGMAVLSVAVHAALVRWWGAPGVAAGVLWTAVLGGLALALIALAMQVAHRPADVYAANLGRATGLFITPNQFAAWLVPFTALAGGVALAAVRPALRWTAIAAALTGAVALIATFSIGGWIGGAAALVLALWWLGRRALAGGTALVLVAVALLALYAPGLTHHRSSERFVRLDAMRAGVRIALAFPLLGVGPMNYALVYPAFRTPSSTEDAIIGTHPHDVAVSLFAETGIAGVAAIAFGWWRIARAVRVGYRRIDPRAQRLLACVCAGIAGRFVHGAVDLVGVVELAFFWIPFAGLAIAIARDGVTGLESAR
jgi:O-antigen ligase